MTASAPPPCTTNLSRPLGQAGRRGAAAISQPTRTADSIAMAEATVVIVAWPQSRNRGAAQSMRA
eukprot:9365306-Alexandrium_andersonii.AAC.1